MIGGLILGIIGFALGFMIAKLWMENEQKRRAKEALAREVTQEARRQEEEEKDAFRTLLSYNIDMVYGGRGLTEEENE